MNFPDMSQQQHVEVTSADGDVIGELVALYVIEDAAGGVFAQVNLGDDELDSLAPVKQSAIKVDGVVLAHSTLDIENADTVTGDFAGVAYELFRTPKAVGELPPIKKIRPTGGEPQLGELPPIRVIHPGVIDNWENDGRSE